tara:strand:+ start:2122 stop:2496 length:375 start_codon:yes stop_codon:yes gene_type:complete
MKTLIMSLLCLLSFSTGVYVTSNAITTKYSIPDTGIVVVEFNAAFNSQNNVNWIQDIKDCQVKRVDISKDPQMQAKHKIVVVPTVIVFNEGEEIKRFQANIMMQLDANKKDVQKTVDELIFSDF